MKRPPLPYLLLLPLLAVLVFGNCGGGVNRFMSYHRRAVQIDSLLQQRQQQRTLVKQQLHGEQRRQQLLRIEQKTDSQVVALLHSNWQRKKFKHRRHKIERRLRKNPQFHGPSLKPN